MKPKTLTITETPDAAAGTVIGSPVGGLEEATGCTIDADLAGNTGGTLDVYIQREVGIAGTNVWRDWVHFAQQADGAAANTVTIDCARMSATAIAAVGTGTAGAATPALAAGAIACQTPRGRVRLVLVSGAGTSASTLRTVRITAAYD